MMTGAPNSGVTAFSGMTPLSPGITHNKLQTSAVTEPIKIVAGNNVR